MAPEPSLDPGGGSTHGLKRKAEPEQREAAGSAEKRRIDGSAELRRLFGLEACGSFVLVVGDGNLSFAAALAADAAAAGSDLRLLATAYEDAQAHAGAFGKDAAERASELVARGARVAYAVDATRLAETLPQGSRGPFARIVFQFPQHPVRHKICKHRELLRAFFASAAGLLEAGGEVVVSLCKGQGGTPAEQELRLVKDTFQVQDAAAAAGLVMRAVRPCPVDELLELGYTCTGFRAHERVVVTTRAGVQLDRPFHLDGSLTHVFCHEGAGRAAAYPLVWRHDVSFWISEGYREEEFQVIAREVCGEGIVASLELLDEYDSPDGRKARTYCIQMTTDTRALSSQAANLLRDAIHERLFVMEGVQPRTRKGDKLKGAEASRSGTEAAIA